jgi:hypothetical protein
MNHQDAQIATGLRQWAKNRASEEHPTAELLADYATGELGAAQAEALCEHLSVCPDCAAMVLELGAAPAADGDAEWSGIRTRLDLPALVAAADSGSHSSPSSQAHHATRRNFLALAAALTGMVIGGLFGIGYEVPKAPDSAVQSVSLKRPVRGIPPVTAEIAVKPQAKELVLQLPCLESRAERYRVTARNETEKRGWKPWEATPDEYWNVPVHLSPRLHGLGLYHIELVPLGVEQPVPCSFEIELVAEGSATPDS